MVKVIVLFIASIVLTAVFSYSLQFYLHENFVVLTLKTMLIPCFTWSILMAFAYKLLTKTERLQYLLVAGWVCAIGSAVLVPGGIYNFAVAQPHIEVSVVNVLLCVVVMSVLFYWLLQKKGFSLKWWWAYNVLICVNMTIFYFAATGGFVS